MRELTEMFLPELHQAWWAETLAQLGDAARLATDAKSLEAIDARIRDHYKRRDDIELTRIRLLGAGETALPKSPEGTALNPRGR